MKKVILSLLGIFIVVTNSLFFSACRDIKPKLDKKEAMRNLEREDYQTEDVEAEGYLECIVEKAFIATNGEDWIIFMEFDCAKSAKKYFKQKECVYKEEECYLELLQYAIDEYKSNILEENLDYVREEIDTYEDKYKDLVRGYSGKYVWFGTENAIEDTKD